MKQKTTSILGGGALLLSCFLLSQAQEAPPRIEEAGQAVVEHADCSFFASRDKLNKRGAGHAQGDQLGEITGQVTRKRSAVPAARMQSFEHPSKSGTIDKYLFLDMQANNVAPADKTSDFQFIRRVTLDLT